mmetsp:Transcript_46899/g.109590  ORF Transcript_46899/g.109590 Transcript_46899/m.109590 type:complete len:267 (+) Transcript_46899:171-971(+)
MQAPVSSPSSLEQLSCKSSSAASSDLFPGGSAATAARPKEGGRATALRCFGLRVQRHRSPSPHHFHELLEIDRAVTISVYVLEELFRSPRVDNVLHRAILQDLLQLVKRDTSIAIPVENREGREANIPLEVNLPVQCGSQELGVVDETTAVRIDAFHDGLQVDRRAPRARLRDAILQLSGGQEAITIHVERFKYLPQVCDLGFAHLGGDDVQGRFLELVLGPEALQVVHDTILQADVLCFGCSLFDPNILQRLLSSVARLRLEFQQ